jgi:hypothetical protein
LFVSRSLILFNPIIKSTIIFCGIKSIFTLFEHWSLKNIYLNKIYIPDLRFSVQWLRQMLSFGMWFCVSFTLKMEAVDFPKLAVTFHETIQYQIKAHSILQDL